MRHLLVLTSLSLFLFGCTEGETDFTDLFSSGTITTVSSLNDSGTVALSSTSNSPNINFGLAFAADGISHYEVAIGTSPGGTDVQAFITIPGASAPSLPYQYTGGGLVNGTTYYATVRAVDTNLVVGPEVSTDGWVADVTSPSAPTAVVLSGLISTFYGQDDQAPSATWTPSVSGDVVAHEYALSITSGGQEIQVFTGTSTASSQPVTNMAGNTFLNNNTYRFEVRAVDHAGNVSGMVAAVWTADTVGPAAPTGLGPASITIQNETNTPSFSIGGHASDAGAGTTSYEIAVGTAPGDASIVNWTGDTFKLSPFTLVTPDQAQGDTLHFSIRGVDAFGQPGAPASVTYTPDATPPLALTGMTAPPTWHTSNTGSPFINWNICDDTAGAETGTGLLRYEINIGLVSNGDGANDFFTGAQGSTGLAATYGSGSSDGNNVRYSIRCVDNANNIGPWSTVDYMVDTSAPTAPSSLLPAVTTYTNNLTESPNLSWAASSDPHSGILAYRMNIGTSPGAADVLSDYPVGNVVNFQFLDAGTNLPTAGATGITEGQVYYYSLRAENNATLVSSQTNSTAPWMPDFTGPDRVTGLATTPAWNVDGITPPVNFSTTVSDLPSSPGNSGAANFEIAVGTSLGDTSLTGGFVPIPGGMSPSLPHQQSGLGALVLNSWYYIGIRAVDNAGNPGTEEWLTWQYVSAEILVTSFGDGGDDSPGNGTCATSGGECTLRAALEEANGDGIANNIFIPHGYYNFTASAVTLNTIHNTTITGQSKNGVTIDMNRTGNKFLYINNATVTLDSMSIINGQTTGQGGGAIDVSGPASVILQDIHFEDNEANFTSARGGAVSLNGSGTHTIDSCTFIGNVAEEYGGAVYLSSSGTANINNSSFTQNWTRQNSGAAVATMAGTNTIENSFFAANRSQQSGSAVYVGNSASTTLRSNTIARNIAAESGSAGDGGAVANNDSTSLVTVINNTIAFNVSNSSITGAGLYSMAGAVTNSMIVQNSIVAHNFISDGNVRNCDGLSANFQSLDYNISDSTTCNLHFNQGNDNNNVFPGIELNAENRGGETAVISLLAGSLAHNPAGISGCPLTDQLGNTRVGTCDIGAYEKPAGETPVNVSYDAKILHYLVGRAGDVYTPTTQGGAPTSFAIAPAIPADLGLAFSTATGQVSGTPLYPYIGDHVVYAANANGHGITVFKIAALQGYTVDSTLDNGDAVTDGICDDGGGNCTIRAAIEEINAAGSSNFYGIYVPDGTYNIGAQLQVHGNIGIRGQSEAGTILDSGGSLNIFTMNASGPADHNLLLFNLTLQNGSGTNGGAIFMNLGQGKELYAKNVSFLNNSATGSGGAIYATNGASKINIELDDCTFDTNGAGASGGAVYFNTAGTDDEFIVSYSRFLNNSSGPLGTDYGGALYVNGNAEFKVNGSYFNLNTAANSGGAIYSRSYGENEITNSTFHGNQSQNDANVVYDTGISGTMILLNNTFFDNNTTFAGGGSAGAIVATNSAATMAIGNNVFQDNTIGSSSPQTCRAGGGTILSWGGNFSDDSQGPCNFGPSDVDSAADGNLLGGTPTAAFNGGKTENFLPAGASHVVDAGSYHFCMPLDQTGNRRPKDGPDAGGAQECDSGAVEF